MCLLAKVLLCAEGWLWKVDADWWFCWEFARLYHLYGRFKIVLKVRPLDNQLYLTGSYICTRPWASGFYQHAHFGPE
jgi:hypothetical protein